MTQNATDELKEFLAGLRAISPEKLENLLESFPDKSLQNSSTCKFFLIRCTAQQIRESDFLQLLFNSIVKYVLKREEYQPHGLDSYASDNMYDIWQKARSKFLTKNKNAGEVGELILFLLLESQGIVQLLNKMNLKTSSEMPIHGLDAIHIQVINDKIILHYGQAKMYQNLNGGIDSALDDIKKFTTNQNARQLELNLVSNYIDDKKFDQHAETIKDLISPYGRHKEKLSEANSIFVGYNWDLLQELSKRGSTELTTYLKAEYEKIHDGISSTIKNKISKISEIKDQEFTIYLLPFRDTEDFRKSFVRGLNNGK